MVYCRQRNFGDVENKNHPALHSPLSVGGAAVGERESLRLPKRAVVMIKIPASGSNVSKGLRSRSLTDYRVLSLLSFTLPGRWNPLVSKHT